MKIIEKLKKNSFNKKGRNRMEKMFTKQIKKFININISKYNYRKL